jgi:hypothetical protein
MEWEPTPPPALYNGGYTLAGSIPPGAYADQGHEGGEWDNFATGKQRMFGQKEGEDETGLEGLLAGWGLAESVAGQSAGPRRRGWRDGALRWLQRGKAG